MGDFEKFPEDICAHAGEDYSLLYGAMSPPIFQTSNFVQHDGMTNEYIYTRLDNPTIRMCEDKLAQLEHAGSALLFSSGMAAISNAVAACTKAGDHIVMCCNAYNPAKGFAQYLQKYNIETTLIPGNEPGEYERALKPNTTLFYLESPSTFVFGLQDLRAVADIAQAHGIKTAADNTWASPIFQSPCDHGIDLSLHSASKYLGGHSDLLGGVIAGKKELLETIKVMERQHYGGVMDPHQAWLLMRGLRTLPIRMERHRQSGMEMAAFLEDHPKVSRVFYPGLPSHPQYELGKRQMRGYSSVMSFVTKGSMEQNLDMLSRVKVFQKAVSWGGYDSVISGAGVTLTEEQAITAHMPVGLIRIHVGLEHIDTLKADLEQALEAIGN